MFIHHLATIGLLLLSYTGNFVRIGTLIMLLHDVSDIFLEGAKLFNYAYGDGESIWTDVFFGCFAVVFGATRLIYFPFWVLWVIAYDSQTLFIAQFWTTHNWPGVRMFQGMLYTLQVLHIFWYKTIVTMVKAAIEKGVVEKDIRSAEEDDFTSDNSSSDNGANKLSEFSKVAGPLEAAQVAKIRGIPPKACGSDGDTADEDEIRAGAGDASLRNRKKPSGNKKKKK